MYRLPRYRSDTIREDRKQLVGLLTDDPNEVLEEGAQLVESLDKPIETVSYTHLTLPTNREV